MKIGAYELNNEEWIGTERFTSDAIATIKDSSNATYDDIRNALERLIADKGQENTALAKRIELVFDDMLTKGYKTFEGMEIPPNEEYIAKKEALIGKTYEKYEYSKSDEDLPFFSLKGEKHDTKSTKNIEIKINEEYSGDTRHSLKNTTKDNSVFNNDSVLDKSDYIGYVPITKVKMKTFPPYNESKSDANEWATRWAHRDNVETGAQTLVFYHNRCYVIGKYDSADLKYQIEGRISYSAYESIRKELEEDARNREKQSQKKMVDFLRERNERRNTDEGRGQSIDYSSAKYGREDRDILRLGRKQNEKRDLSSDSSRSDEYDSKDRQTKSLNEGKSYSLKNSKGKALTKGQQEYFKDSKVRDKNGNLLVMYQGSAEDFTVFDRKKSSYANLYGRGFYFTNSEAHASQYGNTKAYYLNITHPVSTTETTITKSQLRKFLEAVAENEDYSFENYGYEATIDSVLESTYGKSDFLMLNDVSQTAIGDLVEAVEVFNKINGTDYDGIMLDTETVTFNSEQAKLTTNENPTSNPDIRFSLKNKNLTINSRIPFAEIKNYINVANGDQSALAKLVSKVGNLKRGTYKNDATGYRADVNADTIRKAIHPTHKKFNPFTEQHIHNLNAMVKLPELFKNAVYVDSKTPQKNKKQNPSYKEFHHFVAPLFMDNGEYLALITAREKVNSNTLYVLRVEVLPTQKRHTLSAAQQKNAVGSQWLSVPSDISIPELVNGVKIKNYDTNTDTTYTSVDVNFSLKGGRQSPSQWSKEFLDTVEDVQKGKTNATNKLYKYVEEGAISTKTYNDLIKKYGAIEEGERPHIEVSVPAKTAKDKKVSKTVRTVLEAEVTPDEAIPTIEKMVEDGVFSYDVYTDKQAINDAEDYLKEHGWVTSYKDWFDAL